MTKNQPDERLVYLVLRHVFEGPDAQLRQPKKIRNVIQQQRNSNNEIRDLINAHDIDSVCNAAKVLLDQQIFESTLRAKIRFPEVFQVSPAQTAERCASEEEAARTEADAMKKICCKEMDKATVMQVSGNNEDVKLQLQINSAIEKRPASKINTSASLYPVYLTFQTQHKLLVTVQKDLETACYEFAAQNLPDLLRSEKWDCAECVELNYWASILKKNQDMFLQQGLSELNKPLPDIFDSMAQLRHTAVHRVQISAPRLLIFLEDAESMAELLRDPICCSKLSRLKSETSTSIEEIKRNKDLLEAQYQSKIKKIAVQRAELEKLERSALDDMFKEDYDYRCITGVNLMQAFESPETVLTTPTTTEKDADSDAEMIRAESSNSEIETETGEEIQVYGE